MSTSAHQITNITPARKNPQRVNIFLDHQFAFSLDLNQLLDAKLTVGQILDKEELTTLKNLSEFSKLYQTTLAWLLLRPRSVQETRDYLTRKLQQRQFLARHTTIFDQSPPARRQKSPPPFPPAFIEQIITQLLTKGYLDDRKFTQYFLDNRLATKGASQKRLRQELLKKGIAPVIIDAAMATSPRSDAQEIQKIIAKKSRHYTKEQLIRYLLRQGFSYATVQSAVAQASLGTD